MGIINIDNKLGIPKYKQIIQSVEIGLEEGTLKKGDKLPSVNSIKNKFSLSRDTVFMAFGELKKRGIVEAVTGKGYYIKSEDIKITKKVFLLFDELNAFKEDLYNAFLNAFGANFQVDIFFHHFNEAVFRKLVNDNIGNYNYYVIMPANFTNAINVIKELPKDKVFVLDQTNTTLKEYACVFQNFEKNVHDGLKVLEPKLKNYTKVIFVHPKSYQPKGILDGYRQFFEFSSIKNQEVFGLDNCVPKKGDVYFVLDDRSLIVLIKKVQIENLIVGKDVGIIAYNDSLLKEIVEGGITTISTNFALMGQRMAKMILKEKFAQLENPNEIVIRKSL
ncbi:GntR family transcriptional regulator [Winogradskyella echinorum]|uniref:GntR family transcriptional regulator n=1 Tax=Winogradskyella echinorum TaxID=538189 RepID=A0ABR6XXU9_9FLAO|nr:GntR family transcriptional regulator [Winogradskyella echinorum]MBC3845349.1 GntR family transcriptional regulator [Winogradskyella echinorum]MBC5749697.1 GntR family transcriptional regulator [Winogradskyella echinorum]